MEAARNMPEFKDLLGAGRPLTPLDEETIALLSDPAMLARVEELEESLHAFKRQLGQEFLDGMSRALQARIEGGGLSWTYMEEVRVETFVGLRPAGALAHDERAFWPVMNFANAMQASRLLASRCLATKTAPTVR